jgi:hypothetical protein
MLQLSERFPVISRDKLLWGVVGAVVLGQLVAFWMLCQHQVRKAEATRQATVQVQRSTAAVQPGAAPSLDNAVMSSALSANGAFR